MRNLVYEYSREFKESGGRLSHPVNRNVSLGARKKRGGYEAVGGAMKTYSKSINESNSL